MWKNHGNANDAKAIAAPPQSLQKLLVRLFGSAEGKGRTSVALARRFSNMDDGDKIPELRSESTRPSCIGVNHLLNSPV